MVGCRCRSPVYSRVVSVAPETESRCSVYSPPVPSPQRGGRGWRECEKEKLACDKETKCIHTRSSLQTRLYQDLLLYRCRGDLRVLSICQDLAYPPKADLSPFSRKPSLGAWASLSSPYPDCLLTHHLPHRTPYWPL